MRYNEPMSESATITPTEPKSPANRKPVAFKALPGVDWQAVELDFIRGATQDELCRKYSIGRPAMEARCYRGGWKRKQKLANEGARALQGDSKVALQGSMQTNARMPAECAMVAGDLAAEQTAWKAKMQRIAGKIADGCERVDAHALGDDKQTKKLAEVASALASVDTIGRRQLGLENEQANQPVRLGLQFSVQVNTGSTEAIEVSANLPQLPQS